MRRSDLETFPRALVIFPLRLGGEGGVKKRDSKRKSFKLPGIIDLFLESATVGWVLENQDEVSGSGIVDRDKRVLMAVPNSQLTTNF